MLNKLSAFVQRYGLIQSGDSVIAAVSGGADSVALLFGLHLLRDVIPFELTAAHFNHHLRGEESDRDEDFVRTFCDRYDIPLTVGGGEVKAGEKGLEAAARDARYAFLRNLPGKVATAHTADDNAETVLMHIIRGTGLKGLGGIAPVSGNVIRPMLGVTRKDVEEFLSEYFLPYVEDSSNSTDVFLRNRIRHHVMPLLNAENPRFSENVSAMALRLRLDEACLSETVNGPLPGVAELRQMHPALRRRHLERFLKESGVREPEEVHIEAAEGLLYASNPSAKRDFPGDIVIARQYDRLVVRKSAASLSEYCLPCPGKLEIPELGLTVICRPSEYPEKQTNCFTVCPAGEMVLRARRTGDAMRLSGGTKTLKKLFIDRKIPAAERERIPVIADSEGVLGVYGFGANLDRWSENQSGVTIQFIKK